MTNPETVALILALVAKGLSDIKFGRNALTEVKLLREAVTARLDNHEGRLDKLEVK